MAITHHGATHHGSTCCGSPYYGSPYNGFAHHGSTYHGRHRVKYNHRRTEALTAENTAPIRIVVDYSSLYEETAPAYSACFTEGAWFARGLPDGGLLC